MGGEGAGPAGETGARPAAARGGWRAALWFQLAGAAIGLAVISKGPPAAYPVLFLVVLAAVEKRWSALWRFVISGAPVTAAVIALPWFLYVRQDPMYVQLIRDLKNSAGGGRGHSSLFITYIPVLFVATAPWSALWLVALVAAVRKWRSDPRLRGVVVWVGSILIPLLLWRNKQFHYLMPVMPPLMILVGWLLDEAVKARAVVDEGLARLTRWIWAATAIALAVAAPGVVIAGKMSRGWVRPADFGVAALLLAGLATVWLFHRRRGPAGGVTAFAVGNVVLLGVLVGFWAPSLNPENCRTIAPLLHERYGSGPFAFIGKEDLPMVFHLRQIIPVARSDDEIAALVAREPRVVAIEPVSGTNRARKAIIEEARFRDEQTIYRVGRIDPSALPAPTSPDSAKPPASDPEGE